MSKNILNHSCIQLKVHNFYIKLMHYQKLWHKVCLTFSANFIWVSNVSSQARAYSSVIFSATPCICPTCINLTRIFTFSLNACQVLRTFRICHTFRTCSYNLRLEVVTWILKWDYIDFLKYQRFKLGNDGNDFFK